MEQQIVAPDVDDEGNAGMNLRDVRKVLIGSDADVDTARDAGRFQGGYDLEIRPLVRNQVVGVEVAAFFRQALDALGERRQIGLRNSVQDRRNESNREQEQRGCDKTDAF